MTYKLLTILKTSQQESDNLPTNYTKSSQTSVHSSDWICVRVCVCVCVCVCMYVCMYGELRYTFKWD
jgi:hypothetical protein